MTILSCNSVIFSTKKGGKIKFSVIRSFLVPESWTCGDMERNGNSISSDVTDDIIEMIRTMLVLVIFRQFGRCFGLFDIAG